MSLSRILNDDPIPVRSSRSAYASPSHSTPFHPSYVDTSSRGQSSPAHDHTIDLARGHSFHLAAAGRSDSCGYVTMSRLVIDAPEEEGLRIKSPDEHDSLSAQHREDTAWRKKRKSTYEGTPVSRVSVTFSHYHSYLCPGQNMYRVYPSRAKPARPLSPGTDLLTEEAPHVHHGTTDEELRLASSDLEDCEEVWIGELSDYMLETQKRQNQVADWFEASIVVSRFR